MGIIEISEFCVMFSKKKVIAARFQARVAIRFARIGRKHAAFYRIVALDARKKRNTEPLEFLGWYNPATQETNLNADSISKWLNTGAKPSKTVLGLLKKVMQYEA